MKTLFQPVRAARRQAYLPILLGLLGALFWVAPANGETKLDFWHSYTQHQSGVIHYSFQIASYKRGLFFGSCGPSTRSLQWEYDIDLAGPGPVYQKDQVQINSEGKKIDVVAGTITISSNKKDARIELKFMSGNEVKDFIANGSHRIQKLK